MTLTIGSGASAVDITPYVKFGGVKITYSDLDAPNSGRDLAGLMHRGRVATKVRLDVECKPLTTAEASIVLQAIQPEYVTVTYTDLRAGTNVTKTMYSNNIPATYALRKEYRVPGQQNPLVREYWTGLTFPLVER